MPRLAVDEFGQIYETSPDREDGMGFGKRPEVVAQGDLTLGSAYIKSQAVRQQELIKMRRDNRALDSADEMTRRIAAHTIAEQKRKEVAEVRMNRDPKVRDAVLKKALAMSGCECSGEYSTPMSGNVLTANGQYGWRGMTRDQQTIHHVTMGMGANVAHRVDPVEERQYQEKMAAQKLLRLGARR